jgi:hypothetical protein
MKHPKKKLIEVALPLAAARCACHLEGSDHRAAPKPSERIGVPAC